MHIPLKTECLTLNQMKPKQWVIDKLIKEATVGVIHGCATGNTAFALTMAASIATGGAWAGRAAKTRPVLYVPLNSPGRLVKTFEDIPDLPLSQIHLWPGRVAMSDRDSVDQLVDVVNNSGLAGGVIFIDGLEMAAGEFDLAQEVNVSQFMSVCNEICWRTGCVLILVDGSNSIEGEIMQRAGLWWLLDFEVEIKMPTEELLLSCHFNDTVDEHNQN